MCGDEALMAPERRINYGFAVVCRVRQLPPGSSAVSFGSTALIAGDVRLLRSHAARGYQSLLLQAAQDLRKSWTTRQIPRLRLSSSYAWLRWRYAARVFADAGKPLAT